MGSLSPWRKICVSTREGGAGGQGSRSVLQCSETWNCPVCTQPMPAMSPSLGLMPNKETGRSLIAVGFQSIFQVWQQLSSERPLDWICQKAVWRNICQWREGVKHWYLNGVWGCHVLTLVLASHQEFGSEATALLNRASQGTVKEVPCYSKTQTRMRCVVRQRQPQWICSILGKTSDLRRWKQDI